MRTEIVSKSSESKWEFPRQWRIRSSKPPWTGSEKSSRYLYPRADKVWHAGLPRLGPADVLIAGILPSDDFDRGRGAAPFPGQQLEQRLVGFAALGCGGEPDLEPFPPGRVPDPAFHGVHGGLGDDL